MLYNIYMAIKKVVKKKVEGKKLDKMERMKAAHGYSQSKNK